MIGKSSVPAVMLCVLALHATILTPYNIAAEKASNTSNNQNRNKGISERRRHLRRHTESQDHIKKNYPDVRSDFNPSEQHRGRIRSTFEVANDAAMLRVNGILNNSNEQRKLSPCEWALEKDNQDGCTNNPDNIDPSWRNPGIRDHMIHPSSNACCGALFPGTHCKLYPDSRCEDAGVVPSTPSNGSGRTSCVSHGWHADLASGAGCTDDDNVLEHWLDEKIKQHIFHETAEKCCGVHFNNGSCEINHGGCIRDGHGGVGENSPPQKACVSPGWYPDNTNRDGCSNGETYLEEWLKPSMISLIFFSTSEACCNTFFLGMNCKIYDEGCTIDLGKFQPKPDGGGEDADSTCESDWHPDVRTKRGCTNDPMDYPQEWNTPQNRDAYFFSTSHDCCLKFFSPGVCDSRDACNGNHLTKIRMTSSPTNRPTSTPPTLSPTTNEPTPSPVTPTPPPTSQPTSSTPSVQPTKLTIYFIDHFTGSCIDGVGNDIPHWIRITFSDYWSCCANSFRREKCIREGPSSEPTNRPSRELSALPSIQLSLLPTELPSGQPSEPTPSPTTLYWGAFRAFSSKPTQRPTIADCSDLSWRVDTDADQGCTNYNLGPTQHAASLFQTAKECCAISFDGLDCLVRDKCRRIDSLISSKGNLHEGCANQWHPDIEYGRDGCSNSANIPVSWRQSEHRDGILFDTANECCQQLYLGRGNHCRIYSDCTTEPPTNLHTMYPTSPPSPLVTYPEPVLYPSLSLGSLTLDATSLCESAKWHISIGISDIACSNSLAYPETWNDAAMRDKFLFDNHSDCCERFSFGNATTCSRHDDCASEVTTATSTLMSSGINAAASVVHPSTSCVSAKWHMTVDFSKCSNNFDYRHSWLEFEEKYFSDDPAECCLKTFNYEDCEIDDICALSDATKTTAGATMSWSSQNTPVVPCESARWHISQDFLRCSNDFDYPDSWLETEESYFSDDPTECCRKTFNHQICEIEDICDSHDVTRPQLPSIKATAATEATTSGAKTANPTHMPTMKPSQGPSNVLSLTPSHGRSLEPSEGPSDVPSLKPSQGPSPRPATSNPTNSPLQPLAALNNGSDECIGKTRRQCYYDSGCNYDTTSRTCVAVLEAPQPITQQYFFQNKPTSGALPAATSAILKTQHPTQNPTLQPSTGSPIDAPLQPSTALNYDSDKCSGKTRRQCFNDPGCDFDMTSRYCVTAPAASQPIITQPHSSCAGKRKKDCARDPDCIWDKRNRLCTGLDGKVDGMAVAAPVVLTVSQNCEKRTWHPKTVIDRTCSNSLDYPSLWDNPSFPVQYLFNSFNHCCNVFYDGRCNKEDTCAA